MSPPLSLSLPIAPLSPALHAHVTALRTLALSLALLPAAEHHPARVPLTSKASLSAAVTDTHHVLVCLGTAGTGGDGAEGEQYWVAMSPQEAADYVDRRRERLLLQQARAIDGLPGVVAEERLETVDEKKVLRPFHPVLHNIPAAGPSQPEKRSTVTGPEHVAAPVAEAAAEPSVKHQREQVAGKSEPGLAVSGKAKALSPAVTPSSSQAASSSKMDDLIEIMTEGAAAAAQKKGGAEKDETVSGVPFEILKAGDAEQVHLGIQRRRFTIPRNSRNP